MKTDWKTLQIEVERNVATLTLNRPDKLNCFTIEMWRELRELGQALVAEPDPAGSSSSTKSTSA